MDQLEDENNQLKGIIKFKDEEIVKLRQGVIEGPLRRYNLYMNPIVGNDVCSAPNLCSAPSLCSAQIVSSF